MLGTITFQLFWGKLHIRSLYQTFFFFLLKGSTIEYHQYNTVETPIYHQLQKLHWLATLLSTSIKPHYFHSAVSQILIYGRPNQVERPSDLSQRNRMNHHISLPHTKEQESSFLKGRQRNLWNCFLNNIVERTVDSDRLKTFLLLHN